MAVDQFMMEGSQGTKLEVDTPIYKWQGRHFDLIQFVGTSGALKISHFCVEDVHFLAVANSESDNRKLSPWSCVYFGARELTFCSSGFIESGNNF